MFEIGKTYTLSYPHNNHINFYPKFEAREFKVLGIRDLYREPLSLQAMLSRPWVGRSRIMLQTWDYTKGRYRQLYAGAFRESWSPQVLKVAFFEPDAEKPFEVYPRTFEPNRRDRKLLTKLCKTLQEEAHPSIRIGIIADDIRLVG